MQYQTDTEIYGSIKSTKVDCNTFGALKLKRLHALKTLLLVVSIQLIIVHPINTTHSCNNVTLLPTAEGYGRRVTATTQHNDLFLVTIVATENRYCSTCQSSHILYVYRHPLPLLTGSGNYNNHNLMNGTNVQLLPHLHVVQ